MTRGKVLPVAIASLGILFSLPFVLIKIADVVLWDGRVGNFQKTLWGAWYSLMFNIDQDEHFHFMNWGLVTEPLHECVHKGAASESLQANLYAQLVEMDQAAVQGKQVLEVGSGRGAGASFVSRCFCPELMIGLDLNHLQAENAQQRLGTSRPCALSFMQGDAENLPFADSTFDAVINVESSHTYPHFERFVSEVRRVLKDNGTFLFTDFRDTDQINPMMDTLLETFVGAKHEVRNISGNVSKSLDVELAADGSKTKLVDNYCPTFLRSACLKFIGQSARDSLTSGVKSYMAIALHSTGPRKVNTTSTSKGDRSSQSGAQFQNVREIRFLPEMTDAEAERIFKEAFLGDDEPVLLQGAARYLLPKVGLDVCEFVRQKCGHIGNVILHDFEQGFEGLHPVIKFLLGMYIFFTGRSRHTLLDSMPRNLSEFVNIAEGAPPAPLQAMLIKLDTFLFPGSQYLSAKNFKSHPQHGGSCPALDAAIVDGPACFGRALKFGAWSNHDNSSEYYGQTDAIIFGGMEGVPTTPLHYHTQWRSLRTGASQLGLRWKQVHSVLMGEKAWVIYPAKYKDYLYQNRGYGVEDSKGNALDLFRFNAFNPLYFWYSKASEASGWKVTVKKGDILLLPSDNVHQVVNVRNSVGLTFSVVL